MFLISYYKIFIETEPSLNRHEEMRIRSIKNATKLG
jgi:hypothetical protein